MPFGFDLSKTPPDKALAVLTAAWEWSDYPCDDRDDPELLRLEGALQDAVLDCDPNNGKEI